MEIQMYTEQRNNKRLKQLYHKALAVKSAIPHPRILGIIRECGGKMHMRDQMWSEAATDFFEVGHVCSTQCGHGPLAPWILTRDVNSAHLAGPRPQTLRKICMFIFKLLMCPGTNRSQARGVREGPTTPPTALQLTYMAIKHRMPH